jgi:hypothetical protein
MDRSPVLACLHATPACAVGEQERHDRSEPQQKKRIHDGAFLGYAMRRI